MWTRCLRLLFLSPKHGGKARQSHGARVRICRAHHKLLKSMLAREPTQHGGPISKKAEYCGEEKAWEIRYWRGICALLIPLVMETKPL